MEIIEPIGVLKSNNSTQVIKFENYDASKKNQEYIFYLANKGQGGLSVINMNDGKFKMTRLKSNFKDGKNSSLSEKLSKEIQTKYHF